MLRRRYIGSMVGAADRRRFEAAIRIAKEKGAIVTTHDMADPDGLGSAFCIQRYISSLGGGADIVTGQRTQVSERLIQELGMDVLRWDDVSPSDVRPLIIVDTNTPALLGCIAKRGNPQLLVIDHHKKTPPSLDARFMISNEAAISACEMVASLVPAGRICKGGALALAVGIAGDSERLSYAERETLTIFQKLLGISGATKQRIDDLAYPRWKPEMVSAILNEMKNLRTETYRGRVIVVASSSLEHPAILADALRNLNVAIIAVLNDMGNAWYRISLRVELKEAYINGIHANALAMRLGKCLGMPKNLRGGGHIDKVGAVVRGTYSAIADMIVRIAKQAIDSAPR